MSTFNDTQTQKTNHPPRLVRKITANPERLQADPNALLTKHDVADQLEVNVQTVLKWARVGDLDAIRLGRRTVRFTQAAVAKFLARKGR
jgi:excisionase family DNA binding protein